MYSVTVEQVSVDISGQRHFIEIMQLKKKVPCVGLRDVQQQDCRLQPTECTSPHCSLCWALKIQNTRRSFEETALISSALGYCWADFEEESPSCSEEGNKNIFQVIEQQQKHSP